MTDTIIQEIRKTRSEMARQFNYDLHAMCAELRREQESGDSPVVTLSTKTVASPFTPPGGASCPGNDWRLTAFEPATTNPKAAQRVLHRKSKHRR